MTKKPLRLINNLKPRPDLDLIVQDDAIRLTKELALKKGGKYVVLDQDRDIARLILNGWTIDFARQVGANLEEDLLRRDFTLNASNPVTVSSSVIVNNPLPLLTKYFRSKYLIKAI